MAKIVYAAHPNAAVAKARRGTAKGAASSTIIDKRVRDDEGQVTIVRTLDANSSTFGTDFGKVFGKNVSKARRENKKITGNMDGIPVKG